MLVLLPKPYVATLDLHQEGVTGKPVIVIGFYTNADGEINPFVVDPVDGRLSVIHLYDVQIEVVRLRQDTGLVT
jgi:hypothetical protein